MLTAEITRCGYTDTARFHARAYIGYASFAGKKQVEKIKILAIFSGKNYFGHAVIVLQKASHIVHETKKKINQIFIQWAHCPVSYCSTLLNSVYIDQKKNSVYQNASHAIKAVAVLCLDMNGEELERSGLGWNFFFRLHCSNNSLK